MSPAIRTFRIHKSVTHCERPRTSVAPNGINRRFRFPTTHSECPVNLDLVNGYVLGVIGLFALCLYIATVAAGFGELLARLPKVGTRKKRSRNQNAARRWRSAKRSSHSQ